MKKVLVVLAVLFLVSAWVDLASAKPRIEDKTVTYSAGGVVMKGYLAYDRDVAGSRPGVLVVHEWWGLNDYARRRARELAGLGYAAMAIDMFGEGKHTEHAHDAKAWMESATSNATVSMARAQAGLDLLKAQPEVDPKKLAAIGYCFGGKIDWLKSFESANQH